MYKLIWEDNFDTPLDDNLWERVDQNVRTWLKCTIPDSSYTQNGNLILRIKTDTCH